MKNGASAYATVMGVLFTCMSLSLRLAALEVSPHALTLSLSCSEKMHEDCKSITGILPLNTELSSIVNSVCVGGGRSVSKGNTPGGRET